MTPDTAQLQRRIKFLEVENKILNDELIVAKNRIIELSNWKEETSLLMPSDLLLTPIESQVFMILHRNIGSAVNKQVMFTEIYEMQNSTEIDIKILDVFISKLRKKLRPFFAEVHKDGGIDTHWGVGWALSLDVKSIIEGWAKYND